MKLPDWRTLGLVADTLREATPDPNRLVLWLPAGGEKGVRLWRRVGNLPGAEVTTSHGLCATAATAVCASQSVRGLLGKWWARLRGRPAGEPTWVLPNGERAEQQGERQVDLLLVWAEDAGAPLAEAQVRAGWPQGREFRRLGTGLFLLAGVEPPAGGEPLPPACPREEAEGLLVAARQTGDQYRQAVALNDLGVACTGGSDALRPVALLEEALALAGRLGDRTLEADVLGNLGLALLGIGEAGRALALLEQALALARSNGDRYGEKAALDRLGTAFAALGNPLRAGEAYGEALALARALGDQRHEAEVLWQLAVQHAHLGERDRALAWGQAAVDLLRGLSHPHTDQFADSLRRYGAGEISSGLGATSAATSG